MCEYCEPNGKGRFKAIAKNNSGGFATTLVDIGIYENTGKKVMFVHYDGEEPLMLGIKYCPMCQKPLNGSGSDVTIFTMPIDNS